MCNDPYVRWVTDHENAPIFDLDGREIKIGVDYDSVTIGGLHRLTLGQAEQFAQAFVDACWEAGGNAREMALGELKRDDGRGIDMASGCQHLLDEVTR